MIPKYPRTLHWPTSPGVQSDDKIHNNPENFIGREIVITNKLDGGNTCLHQGNPYARSTGQIATAGWFAQVKKYHAWKTIGSDLFYYGEDIAALHSIPYVVNRDKTFYVFNIRDGDHWLSWDDVCMESTKIGLPVVGVEFRGIFTTHNELSDWLEDHITRPFTMGDREGFVIRHACGFDDFSNVCKYVRANHVQTDTHWKMNWKWNDLI